MHRKRGLNACATGIAVAWPLRFASITEGGVAISQSGSRKTALVTGASYGVGAATALALARDGFDVALTATRRENLDATLGQLADCGARVLPLALDLRSEASIAQAVAEVGQAFGALDVLVNNAGANLRKLAVEVTAQEFREVMEVNVTGTFLLTQAVGRTMIARRQGGAIVSIASTHALIGAPERSTYGISKAAVVQMTRMLAVEWAPHGIRVNAVAPGRLDTPSPSRAASGADAKYMQAMLDRIPLRRLATPEEVAAAVAYFASPQAQTVTGQVLFIDGGLTTA
jgi:NAD(P)-dependent dehydrogenase (short-subunit alcohol dehydrogenase family)